MSNELHRHLGFLGGGQMATALAKGGVKGELIQNSELCFCEPNEKQRNLLQDQFPGSLVTDSAELLFDRCGKVVLSVKPQVLFEIAYRLGALVKEDQLIVSIVAGATLERLSEWLKTDRIARVMPNTPAQVLAGASGFAVGKGVTPSDLAWVRKFLDSIGTTVQVSDGQLHAVTALSGSGPAFVLTMLEALADGGVAAGLSREVALQLATQTVLGTALMVKETGKHPLFCGIR